MNNNFFWKDWKKNYRSVYVLLLFTFICTAVLGIISYFSGLEWYAPIDIVRKTESINVNLNAVKDYVFDLPVMVRNYVVYQGFLNVETGISPALPYSFFAIISVFLSLILAAATYFNRLWFMAFQALAVIWVVSLNLPNVQLYGSESRYISFIIIGFFLGLGYYYHAFKENSSLLTRFLSFCSLHLALIAIVFFYAERESSILYLSQNASIIAIILSILFIFNVAYEIILSLIYLLARKKTDGSSNLHHFFIFSLIYLAYLILVFANNDYLLRLDIVYLNEFLLLLISSILGIWGFKKRIGFIQSQIEFRPIGAYLYLAFAIITFSTISWIFLSANDPLVDTFEDMIVFSHIGFGTAFFFYVVFNFSPFLKKGMSVYPIITKPNKYPHYIFRFLGLAIVLLLILRSSYLPYYQAISGYYNSIGDYYEEIGNENAALKSFKVARQYASTNRRSNLKIANQFYIEKNWAQADYYYDFAHYKEASLQSILNQAQASLNAGLKFDALKKLNKTNLEIREHPLVLNMKGLIFEELNILDSALYFFSSAHEISSKANWKEVFQANYLGVLAKNNLEDDSLKYNKNFSSSAYKANFLALQNRKRKPASDNELARYPLSNSDSIITYNEFSHLFNHSLNLSLTNSLADTTLINNFLKYTYSKPFEKPLTLAKAYTYYYAGNVRKAFTLLNDLENATISDAGRYFLLHALWLYEQGSYEEAEKKFKKAESLKVSKSSTYQVLNLVQQGRLFEAFQQYKKQFEGSSIDSSYIKNDPLYQLLKGNTEELPNNFLYIWIEKNTSLSEEERHDFIDKMKGSNYLKLYTLNRVESLIDRDLIDSARNIMNRLKIPKNEKSLLEKKENLKLLISLKSELKNLDQINDSILSITPKNYRLLYQAAKAYQQGDAKTSALMERAGSFNSFFTESVIYSSKYFQRKNKSEKAYQLIVEALRINDNDVNLLKHYIIVCLENNFKEYAEDAVEELRTKLTAEEFNEFYNTYEKKLKQLDDSSW